MKRLFRICGLVIAVSVVMGLGRPGAAAADATGETSETGGAGWFAEHAVFHLPAESSNDDKRQDPFAARRVIVPASYENNTELEEVATANEELYDFDEGHCPPTYHWTDTWDGSFDFGLTGSSGNSDTTDIYAGLNAKQQVDVHTTTLLMDYLFSQQSSITTKNRLYALGRYERAIPDSVLSWYFDAWYEYDQFASFDSRIGFHTGIGILILETDVTTLKTRAGLGASREFGGTTDEWLPEIQFGVDYERRIGDRQKLFVTMDYYPDINDFADFRLNTRAGWELLIAESCDLSLKAGIFDRYYSTAAPGTEPNDLDYVVALAWGF